MGKETDKRQAMILLREHPRQDKQDKQDRLITHLVGLASTEPGAAHSTDAPTPPRDGADSDIQQRLQERLQSAYVTHALASLLPCCRNAFAKRTFDLALGLPLVALALALIAVLALAVRMGLAKKHHQPGEPIFVRQRYVGRDGRLFTGLSIPALRATRLRRFAALPLIFNVIRGEMSLVGPRPLSYAALAESGGLSPAAPSLAISQSLARYYLKPGLTGSWLTNRPKAPAQPKKSDEQAEAADPIDHPACDDPDLAYVAHSSFWRDLAILLRTPFALLA